MRRYKAKKRLKQKTGGHQNMFPQLSTVKLSVEYTTRTASQQHNKTITMNMGFILDIEVLYSLSGTLVRDHRQITFVMINNIFSPLSKNLPTPNALNGQCQSGWNTIQNWMKNTRPSLFKLYIIQVLKVLLIKTYEMQPPFFVVLS